MAVQEIDYLLLGGGATSASAAATLRLDPSKANEVFSNLFRPWSAQSPSAKPSKKER